MVTIFNYFRGSFSKQCFRCREGDDVRGGGGEEDETDLGRGRHTKRAGGFP